MDKQQIQARHIQMSFDFDEFQPNVRIEKYEIFQQIGGGDQAKVYQGRNIQTNLEVAVKIIDKRKIQKQGNFNLKKKKRRLTEDESRNMMMIDSDYVLKCYECYQSKDYKLMFIEYCREGSLMDCLMQRERFPQYQAKTYLKQIVNGLSACHEKKIIHRDIKLENIFLHNGICKIADFGFSKLLDLQDEEEMMKNTILGNIDSMAPQVIFRQQYGLNADIWGLGVIFFQMITGRKPFAYKMNLPQQIKHYLTAKITQISKRQIILYVKFSPQTRQFFKDVFVIDPKKRITWKQLLNHDIFKLKQQKLLPTFLRPTDINQSAISAIEQKSQQLEQQQQDNREEDLDKMIQVDYLGLELKGKQYEVKKVKSQYLNQEQVMQAKSNVNRRQDLIYEWGRFIHNECYRAQYILQKIILPIQNHHLLDLTQLVPLRAMFLLCNRCRNYISPISSQYNKNKSSKIMNQLNSLVKKLYKEIWEKWDYYDRKLGRQEVLNEKSKKEVVYNEYSQEFKYFNGFQDMREYRPQDWKNAQLCNETREQNNQSIQEHSDLILVSYTKNEQIDFTQKFIQPLIANLKETEVTGEVQSYMKGFRKLCTERFEEQEKPMAYLERLGLEQA